MTKEIGGKFCRWPVTGINQEASNKNTNGQQSFRKIVFMAAEVGINMVKVTKKKRKRIPNSKKAEIFHLVAEICWWGRDRKGSAVSADFFSGTGTRLQRMDLINMDNRNGKRLAHTHLCRHGGSLVIQFSLFLQVNVPYKSEPI